jgi:hypothetical protein
MRRLTDNIVVIYLFFCAGNGELEILAIQGVKGICIDQDIWP